MQLSGNLSLNRFEWAKQKAAALIAQYYPGYKAVYYDIGAGSNSLLKDFEDSTFFSKSFDLFPENDSIEQWDIEHIFPYEHPRAHIVNFLEVVEHLNNPWLCIKNISATMEPGAFLILSTPNPGWSTSRINLLAKGFLTCFTQSDLDLNHHVFIAWPHILEKLLNDNGFEIVEYVTLDGPTQLFNNNIKAASSFSQIPARLIKKMIEKADPTSMGMSYGVVARKKHGTA